MTQTSVLVGVDGTVRSGAALVRAMDEAERRGARLTVLHCWQAPLLVGGLPGAAVVELADPEPYEKWAWETAESQVAKAVAERGRPTTCPLELQVRHSATAAALLEAGSGKALVVLGGRARGPLARVLLGSVADEVLHGSDVPVMLVPAGSPDGSFRRVVVGVDSSRNSHAALRWAAEVAGREDIPLVVLHAWRLTTMPSHPPLPYVPSVQEYQEAADLWLRQEVRRELPSDGLMIELRSPHASAPNALLEAAQTDDLLVIGARGHGGFQGLLVGSVAAHCTRHARGPLVVLRDGSQTTR